MVFSFFMLNAVFVLVVFMLQQEKDLIFIRWPLGAKANVSYTRPEADTEVPTVEVGYDYLQLEPIGLVFVVFFAIVLTIQVIGMMFHRWVNLVDLKSLFGDFDLIEITLNGMSSFGDLGRFF
jgi:chitin synthase